MSVKALPSRYGWDTSFVAALDADLCGKIGPSTIASLEDEEAGLFDIGSAVDDRGALIRFGTGD